MRQKQQKMKDSDKTKNLVDFRDTCNIITTFEWCSFVRDVKWQNPTSVRTIFFFTDLSRMCPNWLYFSSTHAQQSIRVVTVYEAPEDFFCWINAMDWMMVWMTITCGFMRTAVHDDLDWLDSFKRQLIFQNFAAPRPARTKDTPSLLAVSNC